MHMLLLAAQDNYHPETWIDLAEWVALFVFLGFIAWLWFTHRK
jgi:hypothetical protein